MQQLQLTIPEPCHENWQEMTPTQQGRFCNACAKEVIDFSSMTDIQVLNYFTNLSHEKVCGRALPEQLDRTISRPEQPKKRLFWYWNYIVMFFMFFTKGNGAKAQGGIKPVTECSPVKSDGIRGQMTTKGEVNNVGSRVITGSVTDVNGNPVPFASVRIKDSNNGISTDANGKYSLRIRTGAVIEISSTTFKSTEIAVGTLTVIYTVLEKANDSWLAGEVIVMGGFSFGNTDECYGPDDRLNRVAVLTVKDESSGKAIEKAKVVISSNSIPHSVLTDKQGVYKLKGIKKDESFYIKVTADGYESSEFTISENDFKDRKKEWEILLRKETITKSTAVAITGKETTIRLGGVRAIDLNTAILYVVDAVIMSKKPDIAPDDIENITVLKAAEAAALFGPEGAAGAIIITTRKVKEIKLKEVVITSGFGIRRVAGRVGLMNVVNSPTIDSGKENSIMPEDQVKVYPNPVKRGEQFNIALQLKTAGVYQMQISDAAGRIVLQKQINENTKTFTEKILADNKWSAGLYYVSITDNKNQLVNKTRFIFQ